MPDTQAEKPRGLIAKLRDVKEGSRDLDAAIAVAANIREPWLRSDPRKLVAGRWGHVSAGKNGPGFNALPYTTSLDAALTLVPDGAGWGTGHNLYDPKAHAFVWMHGWDGSNISRRAATAPLALCIAALEARRALSARLATAAASAEG